MNRLRDFFQEPPEPQSNDDYYVIQGHCCDMYAVSLATAIEVERWLDQLPPPRWIVFRDLSGSRHRVLSQAIRSIYESTAAQRAADREFRRARRREDRKDRRPWEDDD